jgi:hypothetical protein
LLGDLELNFIFVGVSTCYVIHGNNDALGTGRLGNRASQVVSERGDPAFARQVVADESDFERVGCVHDLAFLNIAFSTQVGSSSSTTMTHHFPDAWWWFGFVLGQRG